MELRHLRYFVAVAEELSFRRAAERLMMAQPPLSQQIRSLEDELGVRLFDRNQRQIRLTAAGRVFLADAQQIIAQVERAAQRAERASRGELGRLTIGYTSLLHYPRFSEVLRRYHAQYPDVEIVLRDLVTLEQMELLHTNRLDVSFAAHALAALTLVQREQLSHELLLREPLVAALPRSHRLAGHEGPIALTALADEPWIWFARLYDPITYDYMMQLFQQAGFLPRVVQEVNQQQIFIDLVAAGLGVSLVAASASRLGDDEVVYRELAEPQPMVEFNVVWRHDATSPLIQAFLDVVRALVGL